MNDNEFDQLMRSMLADAEEKVPSRVWSSVSERIGNGTRTKVVRLHWGRLAAAVASAAAIVAGAFIGLTSINQTNTNQGDAILAQSQNEGAAVIRETAPESDDLNNVASYKRKKRANTLVAEIEPIQTVLEETLESQSSGEEAVTTEPASNNTSSTRKERKQMKNQEIFSDPFVGTDFYDESSRPRRGTTVTIGGNVFTNGNASAMHPNMLARMKGTSAGYETSVTQVGKQSTYSVPVTVGLGVRIPVSGRFSVSTGLNYSFLERTFNGVYKEVQNGVLTNSINADIRHTMHYVGIPLALNYDILEGKGVQLYVFAGGEVEKAVMNKYRIPTTSDPIYFTEHVGGVQASAVAGLGVTFALTDYLGLYFDPSLRYYFDCNQPTSIRTQQPFQASFEVGFRFNL